MRQTYRGLRPLDLNVRSAVTPQPAIPLPPEARLEPRESAPYTPPVELLVIKLELECITPVVGGGVQSREPDAIERVRLPGIRGQLRKWWRALQPIPLDKKGMFDANALFEQEAKLWGGIAVKKDRTEGKHDTRRSRVSLRLVGTPSATDIPSGRYEGSAGSYRSLPHWDGGSSMGYGLFPLQYESAELKRMRASDPPARDIRHRLRFTLELTLALNPDLELEKKVEEQKQELQSLLATLWCWIHFGGIGARTTRGFGALALALDEQKKPIAPVLTTHPSGGFSQDTKATFATLLNDANEKWCSYFEPPPNRVEDVGQWLEKVGRELLKLDRFQPDLDTLALDTLAVDPARCGPHPRLPARKVMMGQPRATAKDALIDALEQLRQFRQGEGIARRRGKQPYRPGRSFWPEPDTLRRLAMRHRGAKFMEHPPLDAGSTHDGVPRAAFGMPLLISFKDAQDKLANGSILPTFDGARWPSPLIMRPLRLQDGRFVPCLIYLQQPFPIHILPSRKEEPDVPPVKRAEVRAAAVLTMVSYPNRLPEVEGPMPVLHRELSDPNGNTPLREPLKAAGGDAVLAFLRWLETRGYRALPALNPAPAAPGGTK
ncbi:MAG: RAMP superfamily CRISPR-associated protein [Myxococcota bacterium]